MIGDKNKQHYVLRIGILLTTVFFITSVCGIKAYALDQSLIEKEQNGWLDVGNAEIYEDADFSGVLKRIFDAENGCVYIFLQANDRRITQTDAKNVVISFSVKNSVNNYSFSVNKDGIVNFSGERKNIETKQNFSNISDSFASIFIGFELKNKEDRKQKNFITCTYACGSDNTHILFEDEELNMDEPSATSASENYNQSNNTSEARTTSAASSKKFSGKSPAKNNSETKYTPTGNYSAEKTTFVKKKTASAETEKQITNNTAEQITQQKASALHKIQYSASVKASIAAGIILAVAGAALITAGAVSRHKKQDCEKECNSEDKK